MNQHQKISSLINKIQKNWDRTGSGNISRIDKDILTSDLRLLYDMVYDLEPDNVKPEVKPKPIFEQVEEIVIVSVKEEVRQQEEIPEKLENIVQTESIPEPENIPEQAAEPKSHYIKPEIRINTPPDKPETAQENLPKDVFQMESAQAAADPKFKSPVKAYKQTSTSDKFSPAKTLADVYLTNGDNSFAAKMQHNRITDIKAAIGINDKFLFINDIFKGEMMAYNQAIQKLNSFNQYHEAIQFFDGLKQENNVENQEACTKLVEILKRKFH